ncbi:MAG: SGNH/GDSL hydrolase family protein, partial [Gammaproteobacteria bacterium]|nr:SGNH/GDSL hydrolase family protein [Gammaproteobacteria bacterium]
ATSTATNYATGFWKYLESSFNVGFEFANFGIPGESTSSFVRGSESQLDRAIAEIQNLQADGDPATRVHVITLALGANDIFPILEGPTCRAGPGDPNCRDELDRATSEIEGNMNVILRRLREAAGPETLIIMTTYYDPFDFGTGLAFERLSDETMRILNVRIVVAARGNDVAIADAHTLFRGLAARLTHVLEGDVHPLDSGYGVLLLAFQDVYERIGPFM